MAVPSSCATCRRLQRLRLVERNASPRAVGVLFWYRNCLRELRKAAHRDRNGQLEGRDMKSVLHTHGSRRKQRGDIVQNIALIMLIVVPLLIALIVFQKQIVETFDRCKEVILKGNDSVECP